MLNNQRVLGFLDSCFLNHPFSPNFPAFYWNLPESTTAPPGADVVPAHGAGEADSEWMAFFFWDLYGFVIWVYQIILGYLWAFFFYSMDYCLSENG